MQNPGANERVVISNTLTNDAHIFSSDLVVKLATLLCNHCTVLLLLFSL